MLGSGAVCAVLSAGPRCPGLCLNRTPSAASPTSVPALTRHFGAARRARCRVSASDSDAGDISELFEAHFRHKVYHSVTPHYESLGAKMEASVQRYYKEVWNDANIDVLDAIAERGLVTADAVWYSDDEFVGLARCKAVIKEYVQMFPNIHFTLDFTLTDERKHVVVAHWKATCASLGTSLASGRVSRMAGIDTFYFNSKRQGSMAPKITNIISYRQPFADEAAALGARDPF